MQPADYDKRLTLARADLAAAELEGVIDAPRYVTGEARIVSASYALLRLSPDCGEVATTLLHGEEFTVYEDESGWAWGRATLDGYVGYVPSAALGKPGEIATHHVAALATHLYPEPNIRIEPVGAYYMNTPVAVEGIHGEFARLKGGLYAPRAHLERKGRFEEDFVAVAEIFLGAPYLWGGKTIAGLDCSGLVQTALQRAGRAAPRDSDMQESALGEKIKRKGPYKRGDLAFWRGHVGIMADETRVIHANIHHMRVAIEPLSRAAARISKGGGGPLTSVRRLAQ